MPDDNFDYQKAADERHNQKLQAAFSELTRTVRPRPTPAEQAMRALAFMIFFSITALVFVLSWWAILWLVGNMP